MKRRVALLVCLTSFAAAGGLRTVWLTADPPADATVGVVWHDEGAWVHNARNRVLEGTWRTDAWNPMYLTPVFTGLEYLAFKSFGVGTWQARTVPVASGLLSIAALWWGLGAFAGSRAAGVGLLLLSTNFFFVMWNRAALMESTLTALLVVSWAAWARAQTRPAWGAISGATAVLAFFTKASAVFFLAALGLEVLTVLALAQWTALRRWTGAPVPSGAAVGAARVTAVALAIAAGVAIAIFVVPQWSEYRFYNWQMSVTRKPTYTIDAFIERASWLPVVHDVLSRMWFVLVGAAAALVAMTARWWVTPSAARLLGLWLLVGLAELVVHDSGNERRYVMLIPALVALAATLAASRPERIFPSLTTGHSVRWLVLPVTLLAGYLVWGSLVRLPDIDRIYAHDLQRTVRLAAALALVTSGILLMRFRRVLSWTTRPMPGTAVVAVIALVVAIDLAQFRAWARGRTDLNYQASIALGKALPEGTLVHGKLANGLSLENRIRPVFIGREFGNYADRLSRGDVRYLLTYLLPRAGYEGSVIEDVLRAYPENRVVQTFPVNETPGEDLAALIDKFPERER